MTRVRDVNERPSYPVADSTTFDQEGYCLTHAGNGNDEVQKTQATGDVFLGVNHKSSYDVEDDTLESGGGPYPNDGSGGMGGMAVEQDGVVNMLCESGSVYNPGDAVYLSSTAGVANKTDSGSDTQVGKVYKRFDLSGDSSPQLVAVNITGF